MTRKAVQPIREVRGAGRWVSTLYCWCPLPSASVSQVFSIKLGHLELPVLMFPLADLP